MDKKHLLPALRYFNHEGQRTAGGYDSSKWAAMGRELARRLNATYDGNYSYDSKSEQVVQDEKVSKVEIGEEVSQKMGSKKSYQKSKRGGSRFC